jgi:hypothetical protein
LRSLLFRLRSSVKRHNPAFVDRASRPKFSFYVRQWHQLVDRLEKAESFSNRPVGAGLIPDILSCSVVRKQAACGTNLRKRRQGYLRVTRAAMLGQEEFMQQTVYLQQAIARDVHFIALH